MKHKCISCSDLSLGPRVSCYINANIPKSESSLKSKVLVILSYSEERCMAVITPVSGDSVGHAKDLRIARGTRSLSLSMNSSFPRRSFQ